MAAHIYRTCLAYDAPRPCSVLWRNGTSQKCFVYCVSNPFNRLYGFGTVVHDVILLVLSPGQSCHWRGREILADRNPKCIRSDVAKPYWSLYHQFSGAHHS